MEDVTIKELPSLLRAKLGPKKVIKKINMSRLIGKGENFGSEMIKLEIITEDDRNNEEVLNAVAKTLPQNEVMRKVFRVQITYTNEMGFYDQIVPTLKKFQQDIGVTDVIDCFPECYGTRKNLKPGDDTIDDDAVIILENLHISGFRNVDRRMGFDLETLKLVLRELATFHGVPLALRLKNPEIFEKVIKPYCIPFLPPPQVKEVTVLKGIVSENKETAHLESKMRAWGEIPLPPVSDMFGTIQHSDMWTNNSMQKFENEKAVANKFVDFQAYDYGSAACDVFFLLLSSVPMEILDAHFDSLLEHYYDSLVSVLDKHQIDTSSYTFKKFSEEIDSIAVSEFSHAVIFYIFVVAGILNSSDIPDTVKQKTCFMVKFAEERGWLQ